jgi:hypothetical protein
MTADVRRIPEEGNVVAYAPQGACTDAGTRNRRMRSADASFARPFDLCASILTMHGAPKARRGGAAGSASRLGKPTQVGGTNTGVGRTDVHAARRVSPLPQGRGRDTSDKEGGRGHRPCEVQEPRFVLVRRVKLQKSVGGVWPRISSAYALQKERQGRVNGGLARRGGRRVKPSTSASGERVVASRAHPCERARIGSGSRVTRERHSAVVTSPKAVQRSWDRGCNDHRIP